MVEVNETKKPVKSRKKNVWLIALSAALVVTLLAALALFCPGIGLLRTPAPAAASSRPMHDFFIESFQTILMGFKSSFPA